MGQQIDWFRRQFLKLADKASGTKERSEFLKLAFMATLKGENACAADEAEAQCREQLERENRKFEDDDALRQADERDERLLTYLRNTTYRKREQGTPDDPLSVNRR